MRYLASQSATNLISIHVRLSSRASLEDNKWEVVYELAGDDLVCSLLDCDAELGIETVGDVNFRSSFFQDTKGFDKRGWKTLCRTADIEILERAEVGMVKHMVLDHGERAYRCV